jgi:hypothetical protein
MSNIYRQAIRGLEQEQEAIMQRHGELDKAIEILQPLAGPEEDDDEDDEPSPARVAQPTERRAAAAPARDVGEKGAAILAMLKKHGGVMKPGELAKAMKLELGTLRYQLKPLEHAKQVVITGVTAGRRISLPGKQPAKEAPQRRR